MRTFPTYESILQYLEVTPIDWYAAIYPFPRILIMLGHISALILFFQSGAAAWLVLLARSSWC